MATGFPYPQAFQKNILEFVDLESIQGKNIWPVHCHISSGKLDSYLENNIKFDVAAGIVIVNVGGCLNKKIKW